MFVRLYYRWWWKWVSVRVFYMPQYLQENRGLVVASRLSENPNVSVLVLEAGSEVENLPEVGISN